MPVGHVDVVGQRRTGQCRADGAQVDDVMGNGQTLGAQGGIVQFLAMPLAVVERDKAGQFVLLRHHVRKRYRIQSARADNDGFHFVPLFCYPGRLRPGWP
mgnify:CR=1 FL=1